MLSRDDGGEARGGAPDRVAAGVDDVVILPLVLITLAAERLLRATFSFLVHLLDYIFPILLQLARFPLFTARILGDGLAALLQWAVGRLPVSDARRTAWRLRVAHYWSWLRQRISYKAFEEAVHHAFERGMAWVFSVCRGLTPGGALLVLAGAVLWLPISFAIATAIHAVLIAEATSLPPWMQLLHPVATFIAKSKLLVLPVYPAAWPQAKKHVLARVAWELYSALSRLNLVQKMRRRYAEADRAMRAATHALQQSAVWAYLGRARTVVLGGLASLAARLVAASHAAMRHVAVRPRDLPLIGVIIERYATHYKNASERREEKLSARVRGFFARWSIKFSAEYYETREKAGGQRHQADS
jgi:hypothetical protein